MSSDTYRLPSMPIQARSAPRKPRLLCDAAAGVKCSCDEQLSRSSSKRFASMSATRALAAAVDARAWSACLLMSLACNSAAEISLLSRSRDFEGRQLAESRGIKSVKTINKLTSAWYFRRLT